MVLFLLLLRKQENLSELAQRSLTETNVGLTSLELNVVYLQIVPRKKSLFTT